MRIDLRTLQPNPMRDFTIDPIDTTVVQQLRESIAEDGFWGGIVCRRLNGHIQIGAGHHRVQAAIEAGITDADVFVAEDIDDAGMVRVYARENATQRGNTGTAMAGTIASAVRFLAKALLTGSAEDVAKIFATSSKGIETLRGQFLSEKGIGHASIENFLAHVPGINTGVIMQQLANLKASGNYARIIAEVEAEIEHEHQETLARIAEAEREQQRLEEERREAEERAAQAEAERKVAIARARAAREAAEQKRHEEEQKKAALARERAEAERELAEKRRRELEEQKKAFDVLRTKEEVTHKARETAHAAATKAAEREKTFDFEGVAKHLNNAYQIQVFREVVTGIGMQSLPVDQQAALAQEIVRHSQRLERRELTGQFIREHTMALWLQAQQQTRQQTQEEHDALFRKDLRQRALHYQHEFIKYGNLLTDSAVKLEDLYKNWPTALEFPYVGTFQETVERMKRTMDTLVDRLHHI